MYLLSAFEILIRFTQPLPLLCLYPSEVSVTIVFKLMLSSMVPALNTLSLMDFNTSDTAQQWQSLAAFGASQGSHLGVTEGTLQPMRVVPLLPQHFHNSHQIPSLSCSIELCQNDDCSPILASHWLHSWNKRQQESSRLQHKIKQWLFCNWYEMMSCT